MWLLIAMDSTVVLFLNYFLTGLSPFPVCMALKELVNILPELGCVSYLFLLAVPLRFGCNPVIFWRTATKKDCHNCLHLHNLLDCVTLQDQHILVHWEMPQGSFPLSIFAILHRKEFSRIRLLSSFQNSFAYYMSDRPLKKNRTDKESLESLDTMVLLICHISVHTGLENLHTFFSLSCNKFNFQRFFCLPSKLARCFPNYFP